MKRISLTVISCIVSACCVFAQADADVDMSASPEIKAFSLAPDNIGEAVNAVNMFTGDLNLPLELVSLPGRNGLDASVSMVYNSNISSTLDEWNQESPAGILGLGWSIDLPRIVVDNKRTGTREDDEYYLVEGGTANRLIMTVTGTDNIGKYNVYQTKKYQFWQIKFYYDPVEMSGAGSGNGPNKWEITRDDGTKLIYGDKNSGRKTIEYVVRWGNWIGNSSVALGQERLADSWNLSEIINIWGDKITFEYDQVERFVGSSSGQKHTEASYLKEITDVFGKKIQFIYADKQAQFFAEPHTESGPESETVFDAYQEQYERKYLDRIEVRDISGLRFLTLQFAYGVINDGTTQAKMLLNSVEQKNTALNALPPMRFSYFTSGTFKGMLQTVTYPTTGSVTYDYSTKVIHRSARDLQITAPTGFSEPKIWIGDNYAVVTWRRLPNGSHSESPQDVVLTAYEWVGEWREVFMQSIANVDMAYAYASDFFMEYLDFKVSTSRDFFAVLYKTSGNMHNLIRVHRNPAQRADWTSSSVSIDVGNGAPSLLTGTNFIAVGTEEEDLFAYTFNGSGWISSTIVQDLHGGNRDYGAANNYLISQRETGPAGAITFNYLTEDKRWISRILETAQSFSSSGTNSWYTSNGLAFVMAAGGIAERAYRWDINYQNFQMDLQDGTGADIFGHLDHSKKLFLLDNSFIGTWEGRMARFDGKEWRTSQATFPFSLTYDELRFAYGLDFAVWPTDLDGITGKRRTFNPNSLLWSDYTHNEVSAGDNYANAGIDYYYFSNGYHYRQPDGTWTKLNTYPSNLLRKSYGGSPRFQLRMRPVKEAGSFTQLVTFKNGAISLSTQLTGYDVFPHGKRAMLKSSAEGDDMFALYEVPAPGDPFADITYAQRIKLYKIVNAGIQGLQKDVVVSTISVATSQKVEYTSIQYNTETAVMDPSGVTAYYNEVTQIPGAVNAQHTARPFGYTKTFYCNGLTGQELFGGTSPTDYRLVGLPYEVKVYDANGNVVSTKKTTYTVYTKDFFSYTGAKVESGAYVKATREERTMDGITAITNYTFDPNTGQTTRSDGSGVADVDEYYKYYWEVYDPTRSKNILSPLIQVKKSVNGVFVSAEATRYKTWSSVNNTTGVDAPSDEYQWSGTGSADFTQWDADFNPSSDWVFKKRTTQRSATSGAPLENFSVNGGIGSILLNPSTEQITAKVNGPLQEVAHSSFEDTYNGNFNLIGGVNTAGSSKTGVNYLTLNTEIRKSGLNPGAAYTVSFWVKSTGGSISITGLGTINLGTLANWTFYEYTIIGFETISIQKGVGTVLLDEVRLHPKKSMMETSTYHPLYGLQSVMTANNQVVTTEFDEWGRVKSTIDENGNILNTYFYNYKN